jgi:hypothetical protein
VCKRNRRRPLHDAGHNPRIAVLRQASGPGQWNLRVGDRGRQHRLPHANRVPRGELRLPRHLPHPRGLHAPRVRERESLPAPRAKLRARGHPGRGLGPQGEAEGGPGTRVRPDQPPEARDALRPRPDRQEQHAQRAFPP